MKRLAVWIIILAMLLPLGCAKEKSLFNQETITYVHPTGGYVVTLPATWEKVYEDDVSATFVSHDPAVAVNLIYEIGGYDYYSMDSLADEVSNFLSAKLKNVKIVEKSPSRIVHGAYRIILQGNLEDGSEVITKALLMETATGIRYYLLFTASAKDYYGMDYLFENIASSFEMAKDKNDLYKQLLGRDKQLEDEQLKKMHEEMKIKKDQSTEGEQPEDTNEE